MKKQIDFETLKKNCNQKGLSRKGGYLSRVYVSCVLQTSTSKKGECKEESCPIWNSLPDVPKEVCFKCKGRGRYLAPAIGHPRIDSEYVDCDCGAKSDHIRKDTIKVDAQETPEFKAEIFDTDDMDASDY